MKGGLVTKVVINEKTNVYLLKETVESNDCWAYFVPNEIGVRINQLCIENAKLQKFSGKSKFIELGTLIRYKKDPMQDTIKKIEEKTTLDLCISPNDGMIGIYHQLTQTVDVLEKYRLATEAKMVVYREKRKREIIERVNKEYLRQTKAKILKDIAAQILK